MEKSEPLINNVQRDTLAEREARHKCYKDKMAKPAELQHVVNKIFNCRLLIGDVS